MLIVAGSLFYAFKNTDIILNKKKKVTLVLSAKPALSQFKTTLKFYSKIELRAEGYCNSFVIENFEYKASFHDEIMTNLNVGQVVEVWIDDNVFDRKCDRDIKVYGLASEGKNYIDIDARNAIRSRYKKYSFFAPVYGIFLIVLLRIRRIPVTLGKAVIILLLVAIGIYTLSK
jgi:hypothetical protein